MPKITAYLEFFRNEIIRKVWEEQKTMLTVEDIGKIFGLSTSTVYNILNEKK